MQLQELSSKATEQLARLRTNLIRAGLVEFLATFDPVEFVPARWIKARQCVNDPLRLLVDFFLLNQSVEMEGLDAKLGDSWRVLTDLGLAATLSDRYVRMNGYILVAPFGIVLFVEPPKARPKLYYSGDSFALLSRISTRKSERALDLCAGSGVQGLRLALGASDVDAVELDPDVCRILQINVAFNDLLDRVNVVNGSLFDQLDRSKSYDVVVSNPPFVPSLEGGPLPAYAEGGIDGLIVTRAILNELPHFLSPKGRAQLIGMLLTDDQMPLAFDELRTIAKENHLDLRLTLLARSEVSETSNYFKVIVSMAQEMTGRSAAALSTELREVLDRQGAKAACTYSLLVTKGSGLAECQDFRLKRPIRSWFI
jgi:hypothetical protein